MMQNALILILILKGGPLKKTTAPSLKNLKRKKPKREKIGEELLNFIWHTIWVKQFCLKSQITRFEGRQQQIEKSIGEIEKYKGELPKLEKIHLRFEEKKKAQENVQIELIRMRDTEKMIYDLDSTLFITPLNPAKSQPVLKTLSIIRKWKINMPVKSVFY